jgi:ligand-binding sensor domain-containing protein/two-component sensor histidine kinase
MRDIKTKAVICLALSGLCSVLLMSAKARGEQLPIKTYTTSDGLAHNIINRIVRDSRGVLWFCTNEGLSRFDGYGFTNYGLEQGLPSAIVNDLLETREGGYWVATGGGLCHFNPLVKLQASIDGNKSDATDAMFSLYFPGDDTRSRHVLSLFEDREGTVWCGTRNGLYLVKEAAGEVKFTMIDLGIVDRFEDRYIECLLGDRRGALWVGSRNGLFRRREDGRVEAYTTRDGLPSNFISSLIEDREGRIWVGGYLCWLVPDPVPGRNVVAREYSHRVGLQIGWIKQLFQATDGSLWAGGTAGLIQFIPSADGRDFRFRVYAEPHGLRFREVRAVAEDRNGNLWVGMNHGGTAKIARSGFTTFDKADGLSQGASIFETRAGEVLVVGKSGGGEWFINRFDGEKFTAIRFPELVKNVWHGWGWNQTMLEDHTGEWWIATFAGLCRFPKVSRPEQLAHTPPKALYTTREGLPTEFILRLFEDSRGDIWSSSVGHAVRPNGLSRWERRTDTFHHYTEKENLPSFDTFYASSFTEDRAGNLWIGFSGDGGLVRYRDGRFTRFTASSGMPEGQIRNMLIDSSGRLWIASYRGGLIRVDDPAAEHPRFVTYMIADGLSSNEIGGMIEDQWGRIYVGTGRGIDRLDLQTGRIKHYTSADGLPVGGMHATLRDRNGALWFSFATGVARFVPEPDPPPVPPPVLIMGLRIAGETHRISALGETEVASVELGPDKNQLQIDFVALGFSPGEGLRYQYKLEGASADWSQLSDQRKVNFANLAPGRYRFLVRAVNADGVASDEPATFSFTILSPVWQRWWFLTIAAIVAGVAVYSIYRYRVSRLLEVERIRTRIAADLHDDIGSNLTKIGILSEVARQQMNGGEQRVAEPISTIARISRESVTSMSDIVWAINPRMDSLRDLVSHMREFAGEMLASRDIEFDFRAPSSDLYLRLGADVRRTVYLVFKEAVNNAVRHAECRKVYIELEVEGTRLVLTVADDGRGFERAEECGGNGLMSMGRRAGQAGGRVEIDSRAGEGTKVTLRLPIKQGSVVRGRGPGTPT